MYLLGEASNFWEEAAAFFGIGEFNDVIPVPVLTDKTVRKMAAVSSAAGFFFTAGFRLVSATCEVGARFLCPLLPN